MSEWTSRVQDHRIWALMQSLGPTIDKAVAVDNIESAAVDALERLRSVLTLCGLRLGGSDPLTIPLTALDALATTLESERALIEAFISESNPAALANANSLADKALEQLALVPGVASSEELIGFMRTVTSHRAAVEGQVHGALEARKQTTSEIEVLKKAIEDFRAVTQATIADLKALLDIERQKISAQFAEQQKLFAEAQEARSNTYSEALRKVQEGLANTLTEQQGQFSTAQQNRSNEFSSAQTEVQKRFGDLMGNYTKRLADQDAEFTKQRNEFALEVQKQLGNLTESYDTKAQAILGSVDARRQEVEKLVGVIGNLGVTSGYQTTANAARASMWIWQGIAVVAMVSVIVFAWRAFLPEIQGDFKWEGFATRVFLTITIGVLAAYAASQADRFFHMEKYNRKMALELAAIDPFIALLPLEEQQKFKLDIGRRSFAQNDSEHTGHKKSPATTLDVVVGTKEGQQVLQLLTDLAHKIPNK